MEHQHIEMKGEFRTQRVATTLPTFDAAAGQNRLVYRESDDTMWFQTGTAWLQVAAHATLANLSLYARRAYQNYFTADQWPNVTTTYDLGSSARRWDYVYAVTFDGTATTATYADLAEKYTAPNAYEVGSIVEVSELAGYDITIAEKHSEHIVGVISKNPGFTMNNSSPGLAVGLVGRVPIRVVGPVNKRDFIVSNGDGVGIVGIAGYKMAIALETNDNPDEKLVECLLKV